MIKKIAAAMFTAALCIAFVGCGDKNSSKTVETAAQTTAAVECAYKMEGLEGVTLTRFVLYDSDGKPMFQMFHDSEELYGVDTAAPEFAVNGTSVKVEAVKHSAGTWSVKADPESLTEAGVEGMQDVESLSMQIAPLTDEGSSAGPAVTITIQKK